MNEQDHTRATPSIAEAIARAYPTLAPSSVNVGSVRQPDGSYVAVVTIRGDDPQTVNQVGQGLEAAGSGLSDQAAYDLRLSATPDPAPAG